MATTIGNQTMELYDVWNGWVGGQSISEFMRLSRNEDGASVTPAQAVATYVSGMRQVEPRWFEDTADECNERAEECGEEERFTADDIADDVRLALVAYLELEIERYGLEA